MSGRSVNGGDDHSDLKGPIAYQSHSLLADELKEFISFSLFHDKYDNFEEGKHRYFLTAMTEGHFPLRQHRPSQGAYLR